MTALSDRLDNVLGGKAATPLAEVFGLYTVEDLLRHYPHRYAARDEPLTEREPVDGAHITVVGEITRSDLVRNRSGNGYRLEVEIDTDVKAAPVRATFFNPQKVRHAVRVGKRTMMSGTVSFFPKNQAKKWSLTHPDYLILPDHGDDHAAVRGGGNLGGLAKGARQTGGGLDMSLFDRPFIPVYPASAKIQSWEIVRCVQLVLDQLDPVAEPLPTAVRAERGLMELEPALRAIHFPDTKTDIDHARDRLRFDEALALQLVMATRRHQVAHRSARACRPVPDGIAAEFDRRLPFELTDGQRSVAHEISADLARPHPMSRLLQGEVGSGKTIVALRAMLQVIDNALQCALLAPTEVLAAQHYRSITTMLGDLGTAGELGSADRATRVVLLTGSMSVPAKRAALLDIVTGDAGIVIGTHALIQDTVEFFDLGMVIVDEQHRFGVEQRDALRAKVTGDQSPHLLVMTATPIPRTIAITMLGDLETSTLTELPKGRAPIVTKVAASRWTDRAWSRIGEEVAQGRQAYVVCSRIGDEPTDRETPKTAAAVELFEQLRDGPLRELRVGLLHGRLPADEKDATMQAFGAGEVDVLVCTTVVEVGVDVPNATVMVIMDADRFGVSQLHQLRGRIGRGGHPGLCIMISDANPSGQAMARLDAIAATNDGFELALLDLKQRREGDILGAAQSGTDRNLKLLSLLDHLDVITAAQTVARTVVDADPDLSRHPSLAALTRSAVSVDRLEYLAKS